MLWTNTFGTIFQYPAPFRHGQGDWYWRLTKNGVHAKVGGTKRLPANWIGVPK